MTDPGIELSLRVAADVATDRIGIEEAVFRIRAIFPNPDLLATAYIALALNSAEIKKEKSK